MDSETETETESDDSPSCLEDLEDGGSNAVAVSGGGSYGCKSINAGFGG